MENTTRLLLRNDTALAGRRILVVDGEDPALVELPGMAVCVHSDLADLPETRCAPWPSVPGGTDLVIVILPRSRQRLHMLLEAVAAAIAAPVECWLVGPVKGGIRGAVSTFADYVDEPVSRDGARHCRLYSGRLHPGSPFSPQNHVQEFRAGPHQLVSLPGVFSHGRLDPGTGLLLEELAERPVGGRVLDLGCGAGVLAVSLAAAGCCVEAVDRSATAVWATGESLRRNGLDAGVHAADGYGSVGTRLDAICTNPPFHQGMKHTPETARGWLRRAPQHLARDGQLVMVANQGLPYGDVLKASFRRCEVARENRLFRVWRAWR